MGSGSQRYVAIQKETVAGTLPVPFDAQKLRVVPGSAIENSRTNISSNEIRDDRQIIVSRLGQNAPAFTAPGELSFDSYDDLIAGALGSAWLGDFNLSSIVVDFSSGATITTDDASDWADKGVTVGSIMMISGSTTPANDGAYKVTDVTGDTVTVTDLSDGAVVFGGDIDDTIAINGGMGSTVVDTSGNSVAVSATNKTMTASTDLWITTAGLRAGDRVYFTGFSNAGNNGFHKVTSITETILTFADSTLVNETLSTGNLEVVSANAIVTTGTDLASFSIEEGFNDVSEYHYITGAKVGTWSASIQTDSIITTEFGLSAVSYHGFSDTSVADSLSEGNTNEVFDSYTGSLDIPGVAGCVITGFDFTLDNGLNTRYALLQKDACSIGEGRTNVTGTLNAYFPDSALSDIYNNEVSLSATFLFLDLDKNGYTFGFPNIKFTSDSIDVQEADVTESIGFQALGGDTTLGTMFVVKQPAV